MSVCKVWREREREESSAALGQRARQSLHSVTYSNRDGALYLPDWIKDPTEDRASWIGPEIRAGANLLMDTEYRRHAGIASRDCCVWCVCVCVLGVRSSGHRVVCPVWGGPDVNKDTDRSEQHVSLATASDIE